MPTTDLDIAVTAARAGAEIVRPALGTLVRSDLKGAVDPVSEIDVAAERAVVDVITGERPGDGVLAEESGGEASDEGRRWLIDPLDGTVNFLHGIPHVGVSVALYENGKPLVGAVIDVMRGETFTAQTGGGAWLDGASVRVSDRSPLRQCVIATGFPYDRHEHGRSYAVTVGAVTEAALGIRRLGAAVLDFAWVACGRLDGFWELTLAPWDAAAGLLLVEEAGGRTVDLEGRPANPGSRSFVASNALVADELHSLISDNRPPHLAAS